VVAEASLPAGTAWPQEAVEEALEALAALLEGDGDQELVVRGTGEDGDLCLDLIETGTDRVSGGHPARQRTAPSSPSSPRRCRARLGLVVEGAPAEVRQAVGMLMRELGRWMAVDLVTLDWIRPAGTAAAGRGGAHARCH
jgi:hypothetical protein